MIRGARSGAIASRASARAARFPPAARRPSTRRSRSRWRGRSRPGRDRHGRGPAWTGAWSSNDGVFVATFDAGVFTSRFTQTNEILAQGTYPVSGNTVRLDWVSVATQQRRSATCTITAATSVTCTQAGGGSFDLNRSA